MEISTRGKQIIKDSEGLYLRAYICPAGVPTIGWGTTIYPNGTKVKVGDVCTTEQAEEYLSNDCRRKAVAVKKYVKVPLSQEMFDALVSWVYNLGEGNLLSSTLLRKLNAREYRGAADEFPKWNKSDGKVLRGLVVRRTRERDLFLDGIKKLQEEPSVQNVTQSIPEPAPISSPKVQLENSNTKRRNRQKR